jgi:hypothetical protein
MPSNPSSDTTGKKATNAALMIDAMDLFHEKDFHGFGLISSGSECTRLATRIGASGFMVYGIAEKKTPEPFRSACDQFIYEENLKNEEIKNHVDTSANTKLKEMITSPSRPGLKMMVGLAF